MCYLLTTKCFSGNFCNGATIIGIVTHRNKITMPWNIIKGQSRRCWTRTILVSVLKSAPLLKWTIGIGICAFGRPVKGAKVTAHPYLTTSWRHTSKPIPSKNAIGRVIPSVSIVIDLAKKLNVETGIRLASNEIEQLRMIVPPLYLLSLFDWSSKKIAGLPKY